MLGEFSGGVMDGGVFTILLLSWPMAPTTGLQHMMLPSPEIRTPGLSSCPARSYGVSSGEAGGGRLALGPAIAALPKQTEV